MSRENAHPRFFDGPPNRVYPDYTGIVLQDGHEYSSRNGKVKEILNPVIQFTQPEFPFLFTYGRMINLAFSMAEVLWILAGKKEVAIPNYFRKNFAGDFSDDGKTTNAAYGYRMRHFPVGPDPDQEVDQLEDTIEFLTNNPDTRHAAMVYRDPDSDGPHFETKDRACNLISHFLLRDKRLHMMQVIRSSDAIWGIPYNLIQWSHVLRYVAVRLKVDVGYMTFHIHSSHMYEPHWEEVDKQRPWDPFEPYYNYREFPLFNNKMDDTDPKILCQFLEELIFSEIPNINAGGIIGGFWEPYFNVFYSYRLWKEGHDDTALDWVIDNVPWPYSVLLLKNFFTWRWSKPKFAASEVQNVALQYGRDMSPGNWFYELVPYKEDRITGRITLETKGI